MASIWCAQGERDPYCQERVPVDSDSGEPELLAIVGVSARYCTTEPRTPCPPLLQGESELVPNDNQYPPLFHFVMSWFVGSSVEVSIVLMRLVSAFIVSSLLALTMWLFPPRYRLVLLLVMLTSFTTQGFFLLASINPSSWAVVGVGVGWLALHAALAPGEQSKERRIALACVCLLAWVMAIGSRWDAAGFAALTALMTLFQLAWVYFPKHRKMLSLEAITLSLVLGALVQKLTIIDPLRLFGNLFIYANGEPDNIAFFTQNFLNGLPNAFKAFGEVAAHPGVVLPGFVYPAALVLTGYFMIQTFTQKNPFQLLGFVVVAAAISLMFMTWHGFRNERDATELSSRYSLPLLVFAVGWWYLFGPTHLSERVSRHVKAATRTAIVLFSFTVFAYAERNVDVQTFGLRYLPEGLDQWWWSWMPVGPNVLVVLAIACVWRFFGSLRLHVLPVEPETSSV